MSTRTEELKARMTAMVASRTLPQIVLDLRGLDAMEFNGDVARVYKLYTDRMEAEFPQLDEAVWMVLDAAEAEHQYPSYGEALAIALQMAVEA